jgi:hypothetical protein
MEINRPSLCRIFGFKTHPEPHSNRIRTIKALHEFVDRYDEFRRTDPTKKR